MALKWKEIELLLEQATPKMSGASLQKIQQTGKVAMGESLVLHGFGPAGPWRAWVCLLPGLASFGLLGDAHKTDSASKPSTFVMVLRKHLLGNPIRKFEQIPRERIFLIHFHSGHSLLCELLPKRANVLLLDRWDPEVRRGRFLGSFRKVSLEPGGLYELPPPPPESEPEVRSDFAERLDLPFAVAEWFWARASGAEEEAERKGWRQNLRTARKKVALAVTNAKKDLEEAKAAEEFRCWGKAIHAKLYELGARDYPQEKKTVIDGREIRVDPGKTWSENAEALFRKSKKFTRASEELGGRLKELEERLARMDALAERLEGAPLDELGEEFRALGAPVPTAGKEERPVGPRPFLEVTSTDGFSIYCGRNQEENRRVTFQAAKGNDVWMHVKGMPGAHVVIRGQKNKTVPLSTLMEAAQVTLYYSKIRGAEKTEVDYTLRKHVKAIKGTLAEVTYTGNKTLLVQPDPNGVRLLLVGGARY
ncbi:MAG: fibronectin/fibrinogen-binding protein [Bdellovibrionales bacterium]|nr:fibronectin/fibrinogen-binding protein [Bdellovibrionales bacterium]